MSETVDSAAKFCAEHLPDIWRTVNVKFIEAPGSHHGFKALAVALACAIHETQSLRREMSGSNNLSAIAGVLARYAYPTYYVSASLLEALKRSSPPKEMTWAQLVMPFPALVFMVPRGSLYEPESDGGEEIVLIGAATFCANEMIDVPGTKIKVRGWEADRMSVFWAVGDCMTAQDCTFPTTQPLEPSPDWITEATERYREQCPDNTGPPAAFSSYIAGLVANLILVKMARPELVETGGATGKRLPSGLPIHRANFIGRKYEVVRRERAAAGGKFTELDWRAGHFRLQHYGPGGKETRVILIDSYIAYTRGLVRKEPSQ